MIASYTGTRTGQFAFLCREILFGKPGHGEGAPVMMGLPADDEFSGKYRRGDVGKRVLQRCGPADDLDAAFDFAMSEYPDLDRADFDDGRDGYEIGSCV